MTIKQVPANANNFMVGRNGTKIDRIVLHWIVGTLAAADATFKDPNRIASATYGIGGTEVHQYVKEEDTAFANGNWGMNLRAISIEHEGGPNLPISEDTYKTSAALVADIAKRYNIPLDRDHVLKHKEVSDNPTSCPGTLDVDRIVRDAKALTNTPTPIPPPVQGLIKLEDVIVNLYRALTGQDPSGDEIAARISEFNQGKPVSSIMEDVIRGDSRFKTRWIDPAIIAQPTAQPPPINPVTDSLWEALKRFFGR